MDLRERFFSLLDSLSALRALSQLNLEGISEDELLSLALGELIRYLNMDSCSIYRVEHGVLYCATGTSMSESHGVTPDLAELGEVRPSMSFASGEGIAGIALETGQLQYCPDCATNEDFVSNPQADAKPTGSLVSAPIKMGEEVLAVLNASHPMADFFEPWQQHTLSLFCTILGQMLHSHRMLHDLEFAVEQRTKELRVALQEAETLQRRYQQLCTIDELTGLNNRRYFFAEAESMLARSLRHQQSCSLMLMDVDFFKKINDQWGHMLGDKVLCAIADVIRQEARGGDLVARVGGEEFVVMLPDTGLEGADLMAQRVQERLAQLEFGSNVGNLGLSMSIGITVFDHELDNDNSINVLVDQLYSQADRAMYEGKRQGRNNRRLFKPD